MRDLRVLFVGDSFVAGVGDPTGLGWVGRVVAGAFAAGVPLTAYHLGVRRETSAQVAARWPAEARPRLLAGADCRVVLSFGANDATVEDGRPRVSPEESEVNLSRALDDAERLALPALVVGPAPSADDERDGRVLRLSAAYARMAGRRAVPFVEVAEPLAGSATWRAEVLAGDGAHPGAGGYALLAEAVTGPLLAWLAGPAA